ncbi:hypothetical protein B4U79_09323 [Dinothrombium tinctorium]|uniref:Uncharacterized protein n=1 Tax=Dinothrombium tinctorium TaxID=1965070 RepID=A0A443RIH3_9ACAR|nr:hypothetical protein B4U79_01936 [Dinothrombium tinctorium]RWS15059.1 hypothetical protein B4U79_09323 [Dinothrombium tinctorium]
MIPRQLAERRLTPQQVSPHSVPGLASQLPLKRVSPKIVSNGCVDHSLADSNNHNSHSIGLLPKDSKPCVNGFVEPQALVCNGNSRANSVHTSAQYQYRQKALHEIRISLLPFMNNERPVSSASSASDSSSSPGQTSGIGSSISSASNQSYCNQTNTATISDAANGNLDCSSMHKKLAHILLTLGYSEDNCPEVSPRKKVTLQSVLPSAYSK